MNASNEGHGSWFHCVSHVGGRSNNEDAVEAAPELGFFAVADGMGGYDGGEVASRVAVEGATAVVRRAFGDRDATWPRALEVGRTLHESLLLGAACAAHGAIREARAARKNLAQMGSTLVACLVSKDVVTVVHVGDSRAYLLRGGALYPLTRDHSLLEELRATGRAELADSVSAQYAHVITRALGVSEGVLPDVSTVKLEPADRLLLCSDGLHGALSHEALAVLLRTESDPEQCGAQLVEAALCAGGTDNITAVLVDYAGGLSPRAP